MANEALMRAQKVFVVAETAAGTLVFPATDGSAVEILATDFVTLTQGANITDNPEIKDTLDVTDRLTGKRPAGNLSLTTLLRPSGSLGVVPQAAVLWKSLFGAEAVNASTSVVYSLSKTKPAFSIWIKRDHAVEFAKGCTVTQLGINPGKDGGVALSWQGSFMWKGICGESTVASAAAASDTEITVADAKRFDIGSRIKNSTKGDDNSGSGYEVTDRNVSTNVITIGTGVVESGGWEVDDVIEPFMPAGTVVGSPVAAKDMTLDFGSETDKAVETINLTMNTPVSYLDEFGDHPEAFLPDKRGIEATFGCVFRKADVPYIYNAYNDSTVAVTVHFGDTDGSKLDLALPYFALNVPESSANAPAITINLSGKAIGSLGEDSATATFV
jgi:hypothetical protein